MGAVRAWLYLTFYSARRQLRSGKTWIALVLLALAAVVVLLASRVREITPHFFWTRVLRGIFGAFIFPIIQACFGTAAIGNERDEKTLVYTLTRPLWRWSVYLGKYLSALPLALALSLGGLWALCSIAGLSGNAADMDRLFRAVLPAYLLGVFAYLALFHLFAVLFRRGTLISIVYVFFIEAFVGAVPGIIKRVSIRYHVSAIVYDVGGPIGIRAPPERHLFLPIEGETAQMVLVAITVGLLALGTVIFSRREFRDLD